MQPERLIDRGRLAHDIDRPVDGFLGHLQREGWFCGDLLRQRDHEGGKLGSRHDMIDHAEPMCLLGAPDIGGEQEFLGLARAKLPGMNEPFDAADAMATTESQNSASLLATIKSQAQASINPPAM